MRRLLPAALPALALAACATDDAAADGPFYPMGVTDGCRTAESRNASFSTDTYRDERLFESEASYRAGWRSGYAQCDERSSYGARPEDLGAQDTTF